MLTIKDVAQDLKVDEETVARWLRSGLLRGIKVGRLWRIAERDLDYFKGWQGFPTKSQPVIGPDPRD